MKKHVFYSTVSSIERDLIEAERIYGVEMVDFTINRPSCRMVFKPTSSLTVSFEFKTFEELTHAYERITTF